MAKQRRLFDDGLDDQFTDLEDMEYEEYGMCPECGVYLADGEMHDPECSQA